MARPRKGGLSAAEWLAVEGQGNRQAAATVSEIRGANLGSITAAERSRRRVSYKFIERQRRDKTQPGQNAKTALGDDAGQNANGAAYSGPRIGREIPPSGAL